MKRDGLNRTDALRACASCRRAVDLSQSDGGGVAQRRGPEGRVRGADLVAYLAGAGAGVLSGVAFEDRGWDLVSSEVSMLGAGGLDVEFGRNVMASSREGKRKAGERRTAGHPQSIRSVRRIMIFFALSYVSNAAAERRGLPRALSNLAA